MAVGARSLHVRPGAPARPDGSADRPYPTLAAALAQSRPGDTLRLAAGRYLPPRGASGERLRDSLSIQGGYSPDFRERDPWGRFPTVLADPPPGPHRLDGPRLAIEIAERETSARIDLEGLLFDGGARALYADPGRTRLRRTTDPASGATTLEGPALAVEASAPLYLSLSQVGVVDTPCAEAALDLSVAAGSRIRIVDSVVANVTGSGIRIRGRGRGSPPPRLHLDGSRILLVERIDPTIPGGGHAILAQDPVDLHLHRTDLVLNDGYGLEAPRGLRSSVARKARVTGNLMGPARIGRKPSPLGDPSPTAPLPLPPGWGEVFGSRPVADRNLPPEDLDAIVALLPARLALLGVSTPPAHGDAWLPRLGIEGLLALAPPVRTGRGRLDRTDPETGESH